MTNDQLRNLLIYIGLAISNMLVIALGAALAGGTLPGFRTGEPLEPARGEMVALLAIIAPILSTWLASNRPRIGSENLSAQVNDLREQGVHRDEMVVLSQDDVVARVADPDNLTPEALRQVADELERRLRAMPAPPPDTSTGAQIVAQLQDTGGRG